jgi:hypothetical protein
MPLQEFLPLQALFAVLQAEEPLQEFTPSHFVLPSVAALSAAPATPANMSAAAAARAAPDSLRLVIAVLLQETFIKF